MRRRDIEDVEQLVLRYDAERADAEFVIKFVSEELYNHEEFFHLLKEMKIDLEPFGQRVLDLAS